MAKHPRRWTNTSVLALAGDNDPVAAVTERARAVVLKALDAGWTGPPFDPVHLAELLSISVVPNADVRDAQTVPTNKSAYRIEFNPSRPRGRLRYSIAHEIAHTLFPDCADTVRHRAAHEELTGDSWQLEVLCNIAAAEFLMPFGAVRQIAANPTDVDHLLAQQRQFDVSTEALFIRAARVSDVSCAMFCAAPVESGPRRGRYRLEYLIGSHTWPDELQGARGDLLPEDTVAAQCTAVGYTAKGTDRWTATWASPADGLFATECVGIPAYPGALFPRVVGMLRVADDTAEPAPVITYMRGDARHPHLGQPAIVMHVVNDRTPNWGGGGFASAVKQDFPGVQVAFKDWAKAAPKALHLGAVHFANVSPDLSVASVVAQHGYGPSPKPRVRYAALREGFTQVASAAVKYGATVHMPRVGCGQAGGSWEIVEQLVRSVFGTAGVCVKVYDPPGAVTAATMEKPQMTLSFSL